MFSSEGLLLEETNLSIEKMSSIEHASANCYLGHYSQISREPIAARESMER
jgi:hypothetical protein